MPDSSSSSTARWSLRLSLLAGGVAVVFSLQPQLFNRGIFGPSRPPTRTHDDDGVQTHCYQSVRTAAIVAPSDGDGAGEPPNCFSVSPDGRFTRVFSSRSPYAVRPGHVLPGLWDGHGHLIQYGEFLHSANLFGAASPEEVRRRLREYLDANPGVGTKEEWGRGIGWDQMTMGGMPFADMLEEDEALRGKYFMLDRVDVHCTWVSRAVLDLLPAGLSDEVPGGEIVRTPGMGVFCDNAMALVTSLWPKPGKERRKEFVASAMKELHKVGLVGMHDAGVWPADIAMYDEMSRTEDWTLRVYAMIECPERNTFCPDKATQVHHPGGMLSVRSVKLFADGALGSWGSAMIEPYSDRPDTSGSLLVNASTLTSLARSWSAAGFQVNIHAIGDLANRLAIDALEASLKDLCPDSQDLAACQSRHRFRIEHSQIIHPADQQRLHAIGIIPSIQPTHATSDMAYAELRLGEERTRTEAYRMRSLLDISPVLGSDFPVEPPNPWEGVYAAVTRKNPHTGTGPPGHEDGWHLDEALTVEQALDGFTRSVARGAFMDGQAGVIAEGAFADWVVLDEDIMAVEAEKIRKLRVRETWVGGKRVYAREQDSAEYLKEDL
ncbi:hypothetical protein VTH06DRAFT_7331 [Thermothelomyces fergusii]